MDDDGLTVAFFLVALRLPAHFTLPCKWGLKGAGPHSWHHASSHFIFHPPLLSLLSGPHPAKWPALVWPATFKGVFSPFSRLVSCELSLKHTQREPNL